MTTTAIATMILICGLVWGGFLTLLVLAIRSESRRGDPAPRYGAGASTGSAPAYTPSKCAR